MEEEYNLDELQNLADSEDDIMDEIDAPELPSSDEIKTKMDSSKKEALKESESYVLELANLYLPPEVLKDTYVIEKIKQDIINLGNCIFNLNQTQDSIVTMQSDIIAGNTNPRTLEVLGQLFKTNMDVMKYKKQYMQILEREYEDFKEIYEKANENKPALKRGKMVPESEDEIHPTISKGTKGILTEIRKKTNG